MSSRIIRLSFISQCDVFFNVTLFDLTLNNIFNVMRTFANGPACIGGGECGRVTDKRTKDLATKIFIIFVDVVVTVPVNNNNNNNDSSSWCSGVSNINKIA